MEGTNNPMKKRSLLLPAIMALFVLPGCGAPIGLGLSTSAGIYATKPSDPPPADTADQIPPHESWCYSTLGESVECYSEPQDVPASRLVNVDPANRYPLTARAYTEVVAQNRLANAPKEMVKAAEDQTSSVVNPPVAAQPVQPAEIAPLPSHVDTPAKPKLAAATKSKAKKHKRKHKHLADPPPVAAPSAKATN